MGKKLFFLSLIVLSVSMGVNWFKNRPKPPPRKPRPVAAVSVEDLQVGSEPASVATVAADVPLASETSAGTASETGPAEVASETVAAAANASDTEGMDPIIAAFTRMDRNPFEPSPFIAMMTQSGKTQVGEDGQVEEVKAKPTSIMQTPFIGTIETSKQLVAILDSRLYRTGDDLDGRTIKKVATDMVTLEDDNGVYLIPKRGVVITLASDGKIISVVDGFRNQKRP